MMILLVFGPRAGNPVHRVAALFMIKLGGFVCALRIVLSAYIISTTTTNSSPLATSALSKLSMTHKDTTR